MCYAGYILNKEAAGRISDIQNRPPDKITDNMDIWICVMPDIQNKPPGRRRISIIYPE